MVHLQAENQQLEMQRLLKQSHSGGYTRQAVEELTKVAHTHLLLGNVLRYCELMVELGEVCGTYLKGGVPTWDEGEE